MHFHRGKPLLKIVALFGVKMRQRCVGVSEKQGIELDRDLPGLAPRKFARVLTLGLFICDDMIFKGFNPSQNPWQIAFSQGLSHFCQGFRPWKITRFLVVESVMGALEKLMMRI